MMMIMMVDIDTYFSSAGRDSTGVNAKNMKAFLQKASGGPTTCLCVIYTYRTKKRSSERENVYNVLAGLWFHYLVIFRSCTVISTGYNGFSTCV